MAYILAVDLLHEYQIILFMHRYMYYKMIYLPYSILWRNATFTFTMWILKLEKCIKDKGSKHGNLLTTNLKKYSFKVII